MPLTCRQGITAAAPPSCDVLCACEGGAADPESGQLSSPWHPQRAGSHRTPITSVLYSGHRRRHQAAQVQVTPAQRSAGDRALCSWLLSCAETSTLHLFSPSLSWAAQLGQAGARRHGSSLRMLPGAGTAGKSCLVWREPHARLPPGGWLQPGLPSGLGRG